MAPEIGNMKKAVLLLAHGAPQGPGDIEEYVLRVRHGRPLDPDQMQAIKDRYLQIGGSPLLMWTERQAKATSDRLGMPVYVGMRHSEPFIHHAIREIAAAGIESVVVVCMTPQYSLFSVAAYQKSLEEAVAAHAPGLTFFMVKSYFRHPLLIEAFANRLLQVRLETAAQALVIFTAHSLPQRVLSEPDPYDFETKETARLISLKAAVATWKFAYQSQGMTSEKWFGPTVESRIDEAAAQNVQQVIIQPVGFVCDHVEILYDIDVFYREYAKSKGIELLRAPSLNDSEFFIRLLCDLVTERL